MTSKDDAKREAQELSKKLATLTKDKTKLRKVLGKEGPLAQAIRKERRLTPDQLNRRATI